jgi:Fe-S-cluster containining protein
MQLNHSSLVKLRHRYLPLLDRLEVLFDEMDTAYDAVARRYGFRCNGCADNCCLTRFYHHTFLEYLFLVEGMATLDTAARQAIVAKAVSVNGRTAVAKRRNDSLRIMCPLNQQERCSLYPFRPMICRLHGIPHELHRPDGSIIKNPGCNAFFDQCRESGRTVYIPFDRTPYYRKMAVLENELRQAIGYGGKIKMTVAQMLATLDERIDEID